MCAAAHAPRLHALFTVKMTGSSLLMYSNAAGSFIATRGTGDTGKGRRVVCIFASPAQLPVIKRKRKQERERAPAAAGKLISRRILDSLPVGSVSRLPPARRSLLMQSFEKESSLN